MSSSSKSKSLRGSLARSYQLLSQNKKKKEKYSASSQPVSAKAGVREKIDVASSGERDLERGDSEERLTPQQSSPISINTTEDPSNPPKPRFSESLDSALGASAITQTTVGTVDEIQNGSARITERRIADLCEEEKDELTDALSDPQKLWESFFSGVIDDSADAVEENIDETEAQLTHSVEVHQARRRGEHRFAGVCNFPLKLIFTPLKQGRRVANTFASLLEMQFGPLHAALQVGNVILEWDDSSLVSPYLCAYEDQILQVDMQPFSEWVKYTGKEHTQMKKAVEGLDYGQQIELIYKVSSEKKRLIDALINVIVRYNKHYYYNLFDRNCQHFVCEALKALEVELPREFMGGLGDYYKALLRGRTPSVPAKFRTHSDLDLYVMTKKGEGVLADMPQHDLEYILALYFRFHLEIKTKLKGNRKALDEWRCSEEQCCARDIERLIDLKSMAIHDFKTIS